MSRHPESVIALGLAARKYFGLEERTLLPAQRSATPPLNNVLNALKEDRRRKKRSNVSTRGKDGNESVEGVN